MFATAHKKTSSLRRSFLLRKERFLGLPRPGLLVIRVAQDVDQKASSPSPAVKLNAVANDVERSVKAAPRNEEGNKELREFKLIIANETKANRVPKIRPPLLPY